ncbi:MAG: YggS family pyridoxal phosphate-dependent enzyme [Oscillospiraceae bacterium]|jgi:pyridoxal phosphate enzyme (YggS family)
MTEEISADEIRDNVLRIEEDISRIAGSRAESVRLMAVTKTRPVEEIEMCLRAGITLVGENRPQEFRDKYPFFEKEGCEAHLIGHLQKNKVKYVVGKAACIESADSEEILGEISKKAMELGIVQDVMLEVNTGMEEQKTGMSPDDLQRAVETAAGLPGIRVTGLMTVAPIADDSVVESVFEQTRRMFVDINNEKIDNIRMNFLSMGMSGDYKLALKHGANVLRIGRAIFTRGFGGNA